MQPAPTQASQNATSVESSDNTTHVQQHGLPDARQPASGSPPPEDESREPGGPPTDPDAAPATGEEGIRGRQANVGRVNIRNDSSQETSPGSRVDEYERANAIPRRPSDGMIFQVVPNAQGKVSSISIQEFPNGGCQPWL
jgi:hypothetical protein